MDPSYKVLPWLTYWSTRHQTKLPNRRDQRSRKKNLFRQKSFAFSSYFFENFRIFTQKIRFESYVLFHQFQPKPKIPLSSWTFELLNIRLYKTKNWCFSRKKLLKIFLSLVTENLNYFCISQVYLCTSSLSKMANESYIFSEQTLFKIYLISFCAKLLQMRHHFSLFANCQLIFSLHSSCCCCL